MFSALCGTGNHNDRNKRKRDENTDLAYRKLPGKIGKCLCSDGKVKPCGFGKNHPRRRLAVFFPKTLPYRRHLPSGPCSSRAAKARIFTIKKIKSHEPSICHKRTASSHEPHGHGDHSAAACVKQTREKAPPDFSVQEFAVPHDHHGGARRGMNTIRQFCFGSLRVVHMGDTGCVPEEITLAALHGCDALLLPIGGYYTVDAEEAFAIAKKIAPRCIVPMHYRGEGFGFDDGNNFLLVQAAVSIIAK